MSVSAPQFLSFSKDNSETELKLITSEVGKENGFPIMVELKTCLIIF